MVVVGEIVGLKVKVKNLWGDERISRAVTVIKRQF